MIYLVIDIHQFPDTRIDKGYHIFVDRMKEGSMNTLNRNVLECKSKKEIDTTIKLFIDKYKKDHQYLKLW